LPVLALLASILGPRAETVPKALLQHAYEQVGVTLRYDPGYRIILSLTPAGMSRSIEAFAPTW
jgi:uncharacterized protein YijF (DUF1287 family)